MPPRKRLNSNQDLPLYLYHSGGDYWRYKNPKTGVVTGFSATREKAIEIATRANRRLLMAADPLQKILDPKGNTVEALCVRYQKERQSQLELAVSSLQNENYRISRIIAELGPLQVNDVDVQVLSDWLDERFKGSPYVKHRGTLAKLFDFAIAKGLFKGSNPASATLTAPKQDTKVQRRPLKKEWYDAIRAQAPTWLQLMMDVALITLQRRGDLTRMRFDDIEELTTGERYLKVIQEKTEKHGERAFLRIRIGETLEDQIRKARLMMPVSPYIIHHQPKRKVKSKDRDHWTQLRGDYVGKQFEKLRDLVPEIKALPTEEKPTFHGIRALGGALYLQNGYSDEYVNLLMGHTTMKMTDHYTDQHITWTDCAAELKL